MKEIKSLDRLFQEKFKDFEINPSEVVWEQLSQKLHRTNTKNRNPLWYWMSGMAVGLGLLFVLNNPFLNTDSFPYENYHNFTDIENVTEDINVPPTNTQLQPFNFNYSTENIILKENKKAEYSPIVKNINYDSYTKIKLSKSIRDLKISKNEDSNQVASNESSNYYNEQKDKNGFDENFYLKSKRNNKWSVSTLAAPVFLNSMYFKGRDAGFNKELEIPKGQLSMSYGLQVNYRLSNKISLQSGVHMVDFAYQTHDLASIDASLPLKLTMANSNTDLTSFSNLETVNSNNRKNSSDKFKQVYGYIEIPLEAKYRLNQNENLGINFVGGFSTLLLNKNKIFLESSGYKSNIGESSTLNSLNFSGNLGFELEYKVYKNVNFNLIPMLKIQTQTLKKDNTYTPYSISLYSGLNLRF